MKKIKTRIKEIFAMSQVEGNFKITMFAIDWFLLLYVVFGSVSCHMFILPELIKALISLPAWVILPYFWGKLLTTAFSRTKIASAINANSFIFTFIVGVYSLIVFTFLLDLLKLNIILKNFDIIILFLSLFVLVFKSIFKREEKLTIIFSRLDLLALLFSLLVSFIPAIISKSVQPFPYGAIEAISVPMEQYQPALRFMEYGYIQHYRVFDFVSIGFVSKLFNMDPMSFIWASSFLNSALFSIGLYLLSYAIFRKRTVGILSVLIGSFLNTNVFRDIPLLFRSNVFMYIFLPFILYLSLLRFNPKNYKSKEVLATLSLAGTFTLIYVYLLNSQVWLNFVPKNVEFVAEWRSHVWLPMILVTSFPAWIYISYCGSIVIKKNSFMGDNLSFLVLASLFFISFMNQEYLSFILFTYIFIFFYNLTGDKKGKNVTYIIILFEFFYILFEYWSGNFLFNNQIFKILYSMLNIGPPIEVPFSFYKRFRWIFEINLTPLLRILLLLCIIILLMTRKREDILTLSLLSTAIFLYLFPEEYAYRFFKEVTVSMALVMSAGTVHLVEILLNIERARFNCRFLKLEILLSSLLAVLLLPNLIVPIYERYYVSHLGNYLVSEDEFIAAKWIRENLPVNILVISDYSTMQLLGPLANKMLPTPRSYLFDALPPSHQQTVIYIKNLLLPTLYNVSLWNLTEKKFWQLYAFGNGEYGLNLQIENQSLRITAGKGIYKCVGIRHVFNTPQNWSNVAYIYLYWYGKNTGTKWQIVISAPDDLNWFGFDFKDDFLGWKLILVPLNAFYKVGKPDRKQVSYIAIRSFNPSFNESWYLGEVGVSYLAELRINKNDITNLIKRMDTTDIRFSEVVNLPWKESSIIIVLTARTVKWLETPGIKQLDLPVDEPVDQRYLKVFLQSNRLELLYSLNSKIFIFKIKSEEKNG